jgi:hypothetical protein
MNWSPKLYKFKKIIIQKNQPVLYTLLNGPERSFVREEIMKVIEPELPPEWITQN